MALDLLNLRQMPGLSHRPNFPKDLHVLLLDPDFKARKEAEAQLRENQYSVTPCSCSVEAAAFLANPENSCDVLLADVRCLQQKSAEYTTVIQAAKLIPLVLMSDCGAPSEVMLGIKLGAVDFLDKPLSPLKLKNIWQHLIRRLLTSSSTMPAQLKKGTAASGTASPEDSGSQGGGSGSHSHGSGGESGSNASTSDQAPVKIECDTDMETSSFQEALGCMDMLPANVGRSGDDAVAVGGAVGGTGTVSGADAVQIELGGSGAGGAGNKPRPLAHKFKANRASMPGNFGGACSSGGAPKPCIGYPAGQMPPLPAGMPGIEWGLPTNPLQISPKAPVGGLLGPMGWPGSAMMGPPMFPSLFPMGSQPLSVVSMPSAGGCGTMHLSASCMTLSSATAASNVSAHNTLSIKRSDSAPLPALSCISNASNATGLALSGDNLMPPPPPRAPGGGAATGTALGAVELFYGLETGKSLVPPPIGLQLKKSPSLLDFISQTLDGAAAC